MKGPKHEPVSFRKTLAGEVEIRGAVSGGRADDGAVIFNLPLGYRPAEERGFPAQQGDGTFALVRIMSNGDVTVHDVTDNSYLSLEGIRFKAAG